LSGPPSSKGEAMALDRTVCTVRCRRGSEWRRRRTLTVRARITEQDTQIVLVLDGRPTVLDVVQAEQLRTALWDETVAAANRAVADERRGTVLIALTGEADPIVVDVLQAGRLRGALRDAVAATRAVLTRAGAAR
jgi:hypothetical protein